jgi:hypothetical protein
VDSFSPAEQAAARTLRHALKRLTDFEQRMTERIPHSEQPSDEDVAWAQGRLKAERELHEAEANWLTIMSTDD